MMSKEKRQGIYTGAALILFVIGLMIAIAVSEGSDKAFLVGGTIAIILMFAALNFIRLSLKLAKEIDEDSEKEKKRQEINLRFKAEMAKINKKAPDGKQTVQRPIKNITVYYYTRRRRKCQVKRSNNNG